MPNIPDYDRDEAVLTESETRLEKPKLFKVIIHNDDFTTMDFVIFVLRTVFRRSEIESVTITVKVHEEGVGVAGIYPYEIAQMKAEKSNNLARTHGHPLLCTVEAE